LEVYLVKGMSNSYLTSDGVLVDAGASVKDVLRAAGQHGIKVRYLFITHYHVDHVRRAAEIAEALGCRVVAPELDSDVIEGRSPPPGGLAGLFHRLLRVRPVRVDVKVRDGDEVEGYRAVAAPGHTPGSTAYVKENVMFSGDAVLSSRGRPVPPPRRYNLDQARAEESFRRLLALRPSVIYPGHGEPIRLQP